MYVSYTGSAGPTIPDSEQGHALLDWNESVTVEYTTRYIVIWICLKV